MPYLSLQNVGDSNLFIRRRTSAANYLSVTYLNFKKSQFDTVINSFNKLRGSLKALSVGFTYDNDAIKV